jgi:hypothetical protein
MAHFAEIDENNIVLRVLRVADSEESIWPVYPYTGTWVQTSYNNQIRKNFAGIGYTYDAVRDAFVPPQPYPSWTLVEETCQWASPVPEPDDGNTYWWDEQTLSWILGPSAGAFVCTQESIGGFVVSRMAAQNIGDYAIAIDSEGMDRTAPKRVSVVTKGARTHGPEDGSSEPITLNVGDFNTLLPDMLPGVRYKITALEADTEYYCISRADSAPFEHIKFTKTAGQSLEIPAGYNAFIGGGETSLGTGPTLLLAQGTDRAADVTSPVFGVLFK